MNQQRRFPYYKNRCTLFLTFLNWTILVLGLVLCNSLLPNWVSCQRSTPPNGVIPSQPISISKWWRLPRHHFGYYKSKYNKHTTKEGKTKCASHCNVNELNLFLDIVIRSGMLLLRRHDDVMLAFVGRAWRHLTCFLLCDCYNPMLLLFRRKKRKEPDAWYTIVLLKTNDEVLTRQNKTRKNYRLVPYRTLTQQGNFVNNRGGHIEFTTPLYFTVSRQLFSWQVRVSFVLFTCFFLSGIFFRK